jgi:hypothetical protein
LAIASGNARPKTPDHPPPLPPSSTQGITVEDVLGGHCISTGGYDMTDCVLNTANVMEDSNCKNAN